MNNTFYYHLATKEDYCPWCGTPLIRRIWNPKARKVVDWCSTCSPNGIKDCIVNVKGVSKGD